MLDQAFGQVYTKFKLHFYKQIFSRFEDREATLTTVESFCMEVITALGEPTIAQFSHMMKDVYKRQPHGRSGPKACMSAPTAACICPSVPITG